jgi:hypothetical protein
MNRSLALLALTCTIGGAACNTPTCGKDTVQHQKPNGELECLPVALTAAGIDCDVDAGARIVAGHCVSAISCGPNTTLMNGQCIGTGGGGMRGTPQACPTPAAGRICVTGVIRHLVDNTNLAVGEKVRVRVYDPLKFLQNPTMAQPLTMTADQETDDTYFFPDLPAPSLGLIAVGVSDSAAAAVPTLQITGSGAIVQGGKGYRVDAYVTPQSLVQMWTTAAGGGVDYNAQGAYVVRYFQDPGSDPTMLIANETMPVAGVQVVQDAVVSTRAKYFSGNLMTLGTGTSTDATTGAAILTGTGDQSTPAFSGMGGNIDWQTHLGNSTKGVVFVDRFHPCTKNAAGKCAD